VLGTSSRNRQNYFRNYDECTSNDFVLSGGGKKLELFNRDIDEWRITFADTGINSNLGERLKAVEKYLEGEEEFLVNYSDGLTDLPLPQQLEHFRQHRKIAGFLCVRPNLSYHLVSLQEATTTWFLRFSPSIMAQCELTEAFSFSKRESLITSARKKNL